MSDMQSADILRLAAELQKAQVDKAAHALGWPDTHQIIHGRPGRVKWKNPYRNYWCGGPQDEHWHGLIEMGLAKQEEPTPGWIGDNVYYTVTELGKKVIRLRLQAVKVLQEKK